MSIVEVAAVLVPHVEASLQVYVPLLHLLLGLDHVLVIALIVNCYFVATREFVSIVVSQWQVDASSLRRRLHRLFFDTIFKGTLGVDVCGWSLVAAEEGVLEFGAALVSEVHGALVETVWRVRSGFGLTVVVVFQKLTEGVCCLLVETALVAYWDLTATDCRGWMMHALSVVENGSERILLGLCQAIFEGINSCVV